MSQEALETDVDPAFTGLQYRGLPQAIPVGIRRIGNVAKLAMTATNPPTQAEVQAIANKIDEIIDEMVAGRAMAP